jgi:hypothetical protein
MSDEELERLRRELRAMGAMNRQLRAQLDAAGGASAPAPAKKGSSSTPAPAPAAGRRASVGSAWLEDLATARTGETFMARSPGGTVVIIDGGRSRAVGSGLLAAGLEVHLGEARSMDDAQLAEVPKGPPVELLETTSGPPFVVIGGQRLPVRGLPLPHPVPAAEADVFPLGEAVNVAKANVARKRLQDKGRVRGAVARRGVVGAAKAGVKRLVRPSR